MLQVEAFGSNVDEDGESTRILGYADEIIR